MTETARNSDLVDMGKENVHFYQDFHHKILESIPLSMMHKFLNWSLQFMIVGWTAGRQHGHWGSTMGIEFCCYISFSLSSFYWLSWCSDSTPNVTSLHTDYSSTCYTFCIYTYFRFQVFFYCSRLLHVLPFTLPHAFTFLSMCSDSVHDLFWVTMTSYIFMFYLHYAPDLSWCSI